VWGLGGRRGTARLQREEIWGQGAVGHGVLLKQSSMAKHHTERNQKETFSTIDNY